MTTTELVGPMPDTVTFGGGDVDFRTPLALRPRVAYSVPRNTLDPRYRTCRDHHVACDCREAELAEQISEIRAELRGMHRAVDAILYGHLTHADTGHTPCACTGCQIVRRANLFNSNGAAA